MSQRGPAPRPASRRSSQSPPRDAASSPPSQRSLTHQDDSKSRPPHDPGGTSVAEADGRGQQRGSRTSGVHNILNPSGPRGPLPGSSPSAPRPPGDGSPQATMGTGPYGGDGSPSRHYGYQSQGPATPQPGNMNMQPAPIQGGPHPPVDRGSPSITHPYPLSSVRRILTPKSPRAASMGRAIRSMEGQRSNLPPHARSAGLAHDGSPLSGPPSLAGPPQYPGPMHGQGPMGTPPTRPTSVLSRSHSQPMMGHNLPPTSQEHSPAGNLPREMGGGRPHFSPGPPFANQLPPSRGMMGEGRWGPGILGPLPPGSHGSRNLQLGDGHQPLLTITPATGPEMIIPVDMFQASKQADEKRQRNAGASARFRQRKKEKEKEQQQGLQKLESENRDLEKKNEELEKRLQDVEHDRDFYRSERNRLRDIISQTPGMEWAERGPSSPSPSRGRGSFAADNSPHPAPAPTPLPHPHSHPYAPHTQHTQHPHALSHPHPSPASYGDPSMLERPARRRRTDSEPQIGTPSYRPNTPASLPPMVGPPAVYANPASPRIPSSPGTSRLPPIRYDQPPTTSETPPPGLGGHPPPLAPQPGQPNAYVKYETGWATGPRGPNEGGPR
ncbi:hypothetical protein B0T25DRAFT_157251 [Lasiosphaeria hispida]|uniref:BZIP domain-containing protein n=1 Tax=Lasiosphaeria hispida TaxID=260671 RepID=A0AAJ0HM37_9PEZI|nr:hypothetical protein B0T25DRAFT_157251 [Lasiosphaeria hispida]